MPWWLPGRLIQQIPGGMVHDQVCRDLLPHPFGVCDLKTAPVVPVLLPAAEQVVRPGPPAVSLGHIPPRHTDASAKPSAVDQLPPGPYRRTARLQPRQQRFQPVPLRIRQVSACHRNEIISPRDPLPIQALTVRLFPVHRSTAGPPRPGIRPSLGTETSSITQAIGPISGSIHSAIRRWVGTGSHADWFRNAAGSARCRPATARPRPGMASRRPFSVRPRNSSRFRPAGTRAVPRRTLSHEQRQLRPNTVHLICIHTPTVLLNRPGRKTYRSPIRERNAGQLARSVREGAVGNGPDNGHLIARPTQRGGS